MDDSGNLETPAPGVTVTIAPANCPCSIWNNSVAPWNVDENDANAIEVGMKFRSDVNGQITGLRFYKSPNNTGTHTGHLWTSAGTLLGSLTFTGESASGWQQASFATPVSITAGTTYVASYHTNAGHYSVNSFYFGGSGFDEWPLHALADGVDGPNAVFNYGTASTFPTQTFQAENYWVDVVLGPVDTTPPTVSMTAPANGVTVSGTNVTVSATAADNTGVAGVQFKLDGVNLGAEVTASPYTISWNSTVASNGTHNLTAVARDAAANTTTSAPVTVTVNNPDTFPPTVSMTAPAGGAIVAGNVTVSATTSDNNGVVGVQFLLDGASLGADVTSSPYTITWNASTTTNGTHTLAARARDAAGNQTTSTAVSVTVANGAPLIDASVSADKSNTNSTIASPTFSTTAGSELLLAFVAADDVAGGNTVTSVAGAGLTWQLVRRTNVQRGMSEIWRAFASAPLTSVSVTATLAQGASASLTVVTFKGVDTSGMNGSGAIGATGSGNANPGAPAATLTTTRANSWVLGVGNDWDSAVARTLGANQSMLHQYLATNGDTFWVQRANNPTGVSGANVTINDTAPTGDRYNLTICEVLPPGTPTWSISGTITPAASGSGATITLSGTASATTTADASGDFTFAGLANGTYTLTPSKSGFTFTPASQSVTVSGANVAGVNFTAQPVPTWSISGTISPGASGSGATMTLSGGASATTTADAAGNFTFTGVVNGTYTVTPAKTGFTFTPANQTVTVSGANVTGVNFIAQPVPTWSISGTISPAASGSGAAVTISGPASAATTADASGNFTFTGLANGTYTVTPSKNGFTFTPANQPVNVSGANVTGVNFTASAAPPLSIDATVFTDQGTSATSVTSPTFSTTTGNELLLAFVAADYLAGANTTVTGVTGAGLTWQLVARTNVQSGTSEIWRAFASAALTNVSVTATVSQSAVSSLTVVSVKGVDSSGVNGSGAIGATASANAASGAPTATLTTTRNNSWVFGVGNDYDNAIARTVGANQTMVHQDLTPTGDTYWVQRTTSTTPLSGSVVSLNDTAPTGDRFNFAICEILPPLQ